MKARKFKDGDCNHIYQRTKNRFNIFYDLADYLVYYTIFCVAAAKYDVIVLGLCLMIDHIHMLVISRNRKILSNFVSFVSSVFVREYNSSIGRQGPLFEERFGSAPKKDKKKLVSAIIYLGNNPVEKHICTEAEQYRWNFIAYLGSNHPFSEDISRKRMSFRLRKAVNIVDSHRAQGLFLNHTILHNMMDGMTTAERNYLTDYIISRYNIISKDELKKHFATYEQLLTSLHSTTGSEYDLKEELDRSSDSVYRKMILETRRFLGDYARKAITCDREKKYQLAEHLKRTTNSTLRQILKFLHIVDPAQGGAQPAVHQ
ncbi:MAG: hypothetical protein E7111_08745 [Bacteroidales bacterium]|nr:hypothetical protein [Bacteroidales bacterium]